MDIDIIDSNIYTNRQSYVQETECVLVGLIVSGLDYLRIYSPDGSLTGVADNLSLFLIPEGFRLDFSFNARRENYVTLCHIKNLIWNPLTAKIEINMNNRNIAVPPVLRAPLGRVELLRDIFNRIVNLSHSTTPVNSLAAEMLMHSILAEFVEQLGKTSDQTIPSVLEQYKKAIDEDKEFRRNITEIAEEIGFSKVHLCRLFMRHYHIEPVEYRARMRFSRIRVLLAGSTMSFKEIAEAVGMNNVTHLYAFVRKRCGITPAQLRRSLRI